MVKVGSLEREILEVLWTQGPLPVREVLERLNASARRNRAYNTVMSTAARMETKGLLERTKQGRRFVYTPVAANARDLDVAQTAAELEEVSGMTSDHVVAQAVARWVRRSPARRDAVMAQLRGRTAESSSSS